MQCETCEYSRAVLIGVGPRTVLRCEDPVVKPEVRLKQRELAKIGACHGYQRAVGGEG